MPPATHHAPGRRPPRHRSHARHLGPRRHRAPLLTALALAVYAACSAFTVLGVEQAVAAHDALSEPVHWGVYRQTRFDCESTRHGQSCTSTGTWTADRGGPVIEDVELDGFSFDPEEEPVGPVRAGYRDFDVVDAGVPDVVYDEESVDGVWIGPAVLAAVAFGVGVVLAFRWGDAQRVFDRLRRLATPPAPSGT